MVRRRRGDVVPGPGEISAVVGARQSDQRALTRLQGGPWRRHLGWPDGYGLTRATAIALSFAALDIARTSPFNVTHSPRIPCRTQADAELAVLAADLTGRRDDRMPLAGEPGSTSVSQDRTDQ
jgi:hypothetical protein